MFALSSLLLPRLRSRRGLLTVELVGHPELAVHTKRGYYGR